MLFARSVGSHKANFTMHPAFLRKSEEEILDLSAPRHSEGVGALRDEAAGRGESDGSALVLENGVRFFASSFSSLFAFPFRFPGFSKFSRPIF